MDDADVVKGKRLLGREEQVVGTLQIYESVAVGTAAAVVVHGEPGIGKTSFLNVIAAEAAQMGATVLHGGASEMMGMPPYLPFLEALGVYIRRAPLENLREQTRGIGGLLSSLFPELVGRLGKLKLANPLPPEQARFRLYEAIGSFLGAIATSAPVVLILDDLQWADRATLELLRYILFDQGSTRLFVLGAYRSSHINQNPALAWLLVELNRLRLLTTVPLEPLNATAINSLAAGYLDGFVSPEVSRLLHIHSEGNPFFAEELLREWASDGSISRIDNIWTLVQPLKPTLPDSLATAIDLRLARLSPEVLEELQLAAIIGRSFASDFLFAAGREDTEQVELKLQEAIEVGLVRVMSDGRYSFTHDKIRESLYNKVSPTRRKHLHRLIGQSIETKPGPTDAQQRAALAYHFTNAGQADKGARYSEIAGSEALAAYAGPEAMSYFQDALDQIDLEDERHGRLLVQLGQASLLTGKERQAAAAFQSGREWFAERGDDEQATKAVYNLGQVLWRLEEHAAATEAFEDALAMLKKRTSPETVEVLLGLSNVLGVSLHQYERALALARRALVIAKSLQDNLLEASSSRMIGVLLIRTNQLAEGISLLEEALEKARMVKNPSEAVECCAHLTLAYIWNGQMQKALEIGRSWETFARLCHDPYHLRHCYAIMAVSFAGLGRWSKAEEIIALAEPIVARLDSPEPRAFLSYCQGLIAYQRGEYEQAETWLLKAVVGYRDIGPAALVWYLGILGVTQAALGKRKDSLTSISEIESLIVDLPPGSMPSAEPLTQLAVIAFELDEQELLPGLHLQLEPFRGQFHDFLVDRLLGAMEVVQGKWELAAGSLAAAEAMARREGLKLELAHTLKLQADLALAQGKAGSTFKARALLGEALDLANALGHSRARQLLRQQIRDLPSQPGEKPTIPFPARLSKRQAEVLRLVAQGMSNRQIAQTLYLSEKTVANHLTAIFNKIGVDNRAAAAAFAVQHDIA